MVFMVPGLALAWGSRTEVDGWRGLFLNSEEYSWGEECFWALPNILGYR